MLSYSVKESISSHSDADVSRKTGALVPSSVLGFLYLYGLHRHPSNPFLPPSKNDGAGQLGNSEDWVASSVGKKTDDGRRVARCV